jgi:CRP-like cAMP-binding protein
LNRHPSVSFYGKYNCVTSQLLAADDLDPLRPHLHPVTLSNRQALSKPGTPIEDVYFVQDGMVSLVQPLENGAMIEVGMIGNEVLPWAEHDRFLET